MAHRSSAIELVTRAEPQRLEVMTQGTLTDPVVLGDSDSEDLSSTLLPYGSSKKSSISSSIDAQKKSFATKADKVYCSQHIVEVNKTLGSFRNGQSICRLHMRTIQTSVHLVVSACSKPPYALAISNQMSLPFNASMLV